MKILTIFLFLFISHCAKAACDPKLLALVAEVQKHTSLKVIQCYRSEEEQNDAYLRGSSKLKFPHSKHNASPALAIDIAPTSKEKNVVWPTYGAKRYTAQVGSYYYLAGVILKVASDMGIELRWGGDWDGDGDFTDQSFNDLVHYELL